MSDPGFIGLLMIADEDDVLDTVLSGHARLVDAFYVLDGSRPNARSRSTCESFRKCRGYWTDAELPRPPYPDVPRDGYRQWLLERAVAEHGYDNWFLLLHGDEVWTFDPRAAAADHAGADALVFLLPFYFPRDGEPWDYARPALTQLRWSLGPGYPEVRMFRGHQSMAYDPSQHANVTPSGMRTVVPTGLTIKHYLYRSPRAQRRRAQTRHYSGFNDSNYVHVIENDAVYWTDDMIARYQQQTYWRELRRDE